MSWNTVNRGCLIALSLFSIVENIEIDVKAAKKTQLKDTAEPILVDVMKNITRVNTMLQDLIKNYEKLEKLSKAHSVEADSTDTEVEELFASERSKRNKGKTKSTTTAKAHKAYATEMFFDERDPNVDSKSESQDTKSSSESAEVKKEERPKKKKKQKENEHKNETEDKKQKRTADKQTKTKINGSEVKNKAEESFVPALKALKDLIDDLSDDATSTDSDETNDKNELFISINSNTTTTSVKPFFKLNSEEHTLPKEKKVLEPKLENYVMPEISRRVRHNTINDLILIGKPEKINLTQGNEAKDNKSNATKAIEPIDKKTEPAWSQSETESEDTKTIHIEELKTSVLRQAYGNACLNLVVRKCYMACKSALRDACDRRGHCPRSVRGDFKKRAISGCKEVFYNHSSDFRKNKDEGSEEFADLTRNGYLSMMCFPERIKLNNTGLKQNVTIDPVVKSMNILRDKYETACQEESMRKCYKACTNAAKGACDKANCSSKRLKEFGKSCKTRCKESYGVRDRKRSDSDSDSDSSSKSDSHNHSKENLSWRGS